MRVVLLVAGLVLGCSANAATIYLCKGYSGGTFWSNALCSTQKAVIDRTATVPDGMPFDQQVNMAQQQLEASKQLYAPPTQNASSVAGTCAQLAAERKSLDQITEKMIWVPIETQNANYHRMNQIKADMVRLGCRWPVQ